ncbi:MAG TPA: DNA N-6-adenine-methyltransferase [Plantibacter sp.]|uniref:DNA N-6-adenine-methyltransferase n=1 Tax=Plantibacter sp. TaxID=1871045 RepID=UPI002BB915F7|nr:DNA N-6-adenine-methyltransferase [Plantibacter sp.]
MSDLSASEARRLTDEARGFFDTLPPDEQVIVAASAAMVDLVLSDDESSALLACEAIVERGRQTFVEVGNALMQIRDGRLYRQTHDTFEDYCRERWSFERAHAYRLIESAQVDAALSPFGDKPRNEAQARELAPLLDQPERLRETWAEVVDLHPEPTAANVREVVQRGMGVHYSSETDDWATPQDLFDLLHREFGFALDVCASDGNAKCGSYYTREQDGLAQPWTGVCWMNPPYGTEIGAWVKKAAESAQAGATVVCLVPARVDTAWWWDYCRFGEVRFLRGRLRFGGGDTGAPFPSAVVVFGRPADVLWWERAA